MSTLILPSSNALNPKPPKSGTLIGNLFSVVYVGSQPNPYKGKAMSDGTPDDREFVKEIFFEWELPSEKAVFWEGEEAQPFAIREKYTPSLTEKTKLGKLLKKWNPSVDFKTLDVFSLLGKPCNITFIRNADKNDENKFYLNLVEVTKLDPKEDKPLPLCNPLRSFNILDYTQEELEALPKWLKEKVFKSIEYLTANESQPETEGTGVTPSPSDEF